MPCELTNTEAHRLTYQDNYGRPFFSKTDVQIVSHANAVAKLKLEANDEEIWTVMKINLPFQVEERFFSDGSITGYHLARVNNKLMMCLELIGVRSNVKAQYKGIGSKTSDLCSHLKMPKMKEIFVVTIQTHPSNKKNKKMNQQFMNQS